MLSGRAMAQIDLTAAARVRSRGRAAGLLVLVLTAGALFYYKWGAGLRAVRNGGRGLSSEALLHGGVLATTMHYFGRIWPALVFGLVIGAAVRAAISPRWVRSLLAGDGARTTAWGGIAGSPLMLCSCCVTPVFTGVWERGARLGPSLAMMLASPGLNVAALTLTFALFPPKLAFARLAAALLLVFAVSHGLGRALERTVARSSAPACDDDDLPAGVRAFATRFLRSFGYLVVVTLPLIVAGVAISGFVLPHATSLGAMGGAAAVTLVALVGVCVALPTFFEIPLALVLLQVGAPPGAAVALLVAGPIVNLPSLLVLARETNVRVAAAVAASVFVVAAMTGLVAG